MLLLEQGKSHPENLLAGNDFHSIWLQEISKLLPSIPTVSAKTRMYAGFDISPKQFPKDATPNMIFSVQDILKPYPQAHQGKYDLVYVRLVCLALREDQLRTAVTNLLSLLST